MKKYTLINNQDLTNREDYFQILDVNSKIIKPEFENILTKDQLIEMYQWMVLQRRMDEKLTQMQRQGRMLTFAPNIGEEALQAGAGFALEKGKDWLVPAFRSGLLMMVLGVPLYNQILYWNGNENGSKFPKGVNVLPINIPIATQISHAAGLGMALKMQGKKNVAVSFIGDGGTAEGEFYEAINFATIHKFNSIFAVNNNQWSISTPHKLENVAPTIAIKGVACGCPGIRVDGNDVFASYLGMKEAKEWAANGNGPIIVEFMTYRMGPHTTSDSPRVYRTEEYEKEESKKEPISRLKKYLEAKKYWTEAQDKALFEKCDKDIMDAYNKVQENLVETLDEVFDHTYETLTDNLKEQKAEAMDLVKRNLLKPEY